MFPKLNDSTSSSLAFDLSQMFLLELLEMLRAVQSPQGWHGSQGLGLRQNSLHYEEPAALWAWPLCTCCLLAVPKVGWAAVPCPPAALVSPEGLLLSGYWMSNVSIVSMHCTCRSGWTVGSHCKEHSQLSLCARGLLGINLLSKDCPCASLKARAERIVAWGLMFFF